MAGAGSVLLVEEGGIGGVADYTDQLARALALSGWEVHLASGRDHDPAAPAGVRVHRLYPYLRGRRTVARALRRLGLGRILNGASHLAASVLVALLARRFDVIHIQGEEWPPLGAAQMLLIKAAGRPIVYTPHNTFSRAGRAHHSANTIIRGCAKRIVVHARYDLRSLSPGQRSKAVVIPHGEYGALASKSAAVQTESARQDLGLPAGRLTALLFGQLRVDKGVPDLLQAAAATPEIQVVLAGEDKGALHESEQLLDDPRLKGRVLVREGFASAAEMACLFGACDVVVLPYKHASASGVLLLAYGFRRPVLVYPVGGLPEYVEQGASGWVCETADVEALARGLAEIRDAGAEVCRARGEAGWRLSRERFGWSSIAEQTISLYREAARRA